MNEQILSKYQKTLDKMDRLLPLLEPEGTFLRKEEFNEAFNMLVDVLKTLREENDKYFKSTENEIGSMVDNLLKKSKEIEKSIDSTDKNTEKLSNKFSKAVVEFNKSLEEFKTSVRNGEDGYTPEKGVDYFTTEDKKELTTEVVKKLKKLVPKEKTAKETVDEINSLPTDNEKYQIDASHIKNLPASKGVRGVPRLLRSMTGDVLIDEEPTNGQVLRWNTSLQKWTPGTVSSGGGASVEEPTGTIDGSNVTFTVSNDPLYVVADGLMYFSGAGYSYGAGTITMDSPPFSFIRSFY